MYYQFILENCSKTQVESLQDILFEIGAVSVSLLEDKDLPIYEPLPGETPYWEENKFEILFENFDNAEIARSLMSAAGWYCTEISEVPMHGWEHLVKRNVKPTLYGTRLWIYPTWESQPQNDNNQIFINLDPGLAFGTGNHPTTKMCLEWLDANSVMNMQGIDYGCGCGVLAIAALKLGAEHMIALDIDSQALSSTINNAKQNNILSSQIDVLSSIKDYKKVDFILANILLTPLLDLHDEFQKLLKHSGILIMTGILEDQINTLKDRYKKNFDCQDTVVTNGWALLVMRSRDLCL